MFHFLKVLGSVFVLRRVATSHVPTSQAETQVDPGITHFHAFFAHMLAGVLDFDLVEMGALISHIFLSGKISCPRQVTFVIQQWAFVTSLQPNCRSQ